MCTTHWLALTATGYRHLPLARTKSAQKPASFLFGFYLALDARCSLWMGNGFVSRFFCRWKGGGGGGEGNCRVALFEVRPRCRFLVRGGRCVSVRDKTLQQLDGGCAKFSFPFPFASVSPAKVHATLFAWTVFRESVPPLSAGGTSRQQLTLCSTLPPDLRMQYLRPKPRTLTFRPRSRSPSRRECLRSWGL